MLDLQGLRARAAFFQAIRHFFVDLGFLEVETPIRQPSLIPEAHIQPLAAGAWFLQASPELCMKRLLARGCTRIFQLARCFRQDERGRLHLEEMTLLEWYRQGANWRDVLADTIGAFQAVALSCLGSLECRFRGRRIDLAAPWPELTVEEAFRRFAGIDVDETLANGCFEQVLVDAVEPCLGLERPTILSEYPLGGTGLSKPLVGRHDRAERWELYVAGLELANACSELTDHAEQVRRFQRTERLRREEGRDIFPLDQDFLKALEEGMPPCAGVAVGVDRLLMVLADATTIDAVVPFGAEVALG